MSNVPKREAEPQTPPASDAELVGQAKAGDVAAYEALVRRHQRRVLAIVSGVLRRGEDIEDVAQQVFIKVFVALKRFDLRSSFPTWLYKVTVNECWDYLRKKRARRLSYEADLSEEQALNLRNRQRAESSTDRPVDAARQAELRQIVERLLDELSREERMMLLLKEVEGFSVEEIGGVLGLNVNTVKVKLFRARGRLMALYRKKLEGKPAR